MISARTRSGSAVVGAGFGFCAAFDAGEAEAGDAGEAELGDPGGADTGTDGTAAGEGASDEGTITGAIAPVSCVTALSSPPVSKYAPPPATTASTPAPATALRVRCFRS
ncbi:hypothetical protein Abr02nite_23520 [Paractinoplanes brasiliensis]|nr:hypothetical protein Abr02nite_23520 [Actinoplanes brasiliensis]